MVREIGQLLLNGGGGGDGCYLPAPSSLSNFRAKTVGSIFKIFSWTDAIRMSLQLKFSLQKSSSISQEKLEKSVGGGGGGECGGTHPP